METTNRNNQGRFVSGHKGAKPKGAINKSTRDYLASLDKIEEILEENLEENVRSLSKKEQVMFWLEIQKIKHVKLSKFTEPEPENDPVSKVTFELVTTCPKCGDQVLESQSTENTVPQPPQQGPVHLENPANAHQNNGTAVTRAGRPEQIRRSSLLSGRRKY